MVLESLERDVTGMLDALPLALLIFHIYLLCGTFLLIGESEIVLYIVLNWKSLLCMLTGTLPKDKFNLKRNKMAEPSITTFSLRESGFFLKCIVYSIYFIHQ